MTDMYLDAQRAYYGLVTVLDPVRFRFWDSREVTMTQLRVMFLIREFCEPSTGELAEQLHVRPATLTGLADRLESRELIRRWPDPSDRRVVRVGLTAAGTALLEEAAAAGKAFLDTVFERMGPDAVNTFVQAAGAFIDAAQPEQTAPAVPAEPA